MKILLYFNGNTCTRRQQTKGDDKQCIGEGWKNVR